MLNTEIGVSSPKLLDLFCGAGGAAKGSADAGFEVVGVDIVPQPHYPFTFVQDDALAYLVDYGREFDAIHASPPCQRWSTMTKRWNRQAEHPDYIEAVRYWLRGLDPIGTPWVIENVVGAPLQNPIRLCGSMFDLPLRRHRLFESNVHLVQPLCRHEQQTRIIGVYGHPGGSSKRDGIRFGSTDDWRMAMETPWMTAKEMAEAIPPAYTRFIGQQL